MFRAWSNLGFCCQGTVSLGSQYFSASSDGLNKYVNLFANFSFSVYCVRFFLVWLCCGRFATILTWHQQQAPFLKPNRMLSKPNSEGGLRRKNLTLMMGMGTPNGLERWLLWKLCWRCGKNRDIEYCCFRRQDRSVKTLLTQNDSRSYFTCLRNSCNSIRFKRCNHGKRWLKVQSDFTNKLLCLFFCSGLQCRRLIKASQRHKLAIVYLPATFDLEVQRTILEVVNISLI